MRPFIDIHHHQATKEIFRSNFVMEMVMAANDRTSALLAAHFSMAGAGAQARPTMLERLCAVLQVADERRRLASLDDRLLRDIGISRGDAEGEASRPFWDLPSQR